MNGRAKKNTNHLTATFPHGYSPYENPMYPDELQPFSAHPPGPFPSHLLKTLKIVMHLETTNKPMGSMKMSISQNNTQKEIGSKVLLSSSSKSSSWRSQFFLSHQNLAYRIVHQGKSRFDSTVTIYWLILKLCIDLPFGVR